MSEQILPTEHLDIPVHDAPNLITGEDLTWLSRIGLDLPDDQEDVADLLDDLNRLASIGSQHMPHLSQEACQQISAARSDFFDLIGMPEDNVSLHTEHNAHMVPLDTFIQNFRQLHDSGVDVALAARPNVRLLDRSNESLQDNIAVLAQNGIRPEDLGRSGIYCLALSPRAITARIEAISLTGLSLQDIISHQPNVLSMAPASFTARYHQLRALGYTSETMMSHLRLFTVGEETLRQRVAFLADHGIAADTIGQKAISLLSVSIPTLQQRIQHMVNLGFDTARIIGSAPNILSVSQTRVDEKITYFTNIGVRNVVGLLTKNPSLFGRSMHSIQSKEVFYAARGIDTVKAFERNPRLIGYDINTLAVRYDQLINRGITPRTLQMCPEILGYRAELVDQKLSALDELGLNGLVMVNSTPLLLGADPEKLRRNLRIIRASYRSYGLADYERLAAGTVERVPSLLAASAVKLRILGRIAATLTNEFHDQRSVVVAARRLDRMQLDKLVAVHHLNRDNVNSIFSLRRLIDATELNRDEARTIVDALDPQEDTPALGLYRSHYLA